MVKSPLFKSWMRSRRVAFVFMMMASVLLLTTPQGASAARNVLKWEDPQGDERVIEVKPEAPGAASGPSGTTGTTGRPPSSPDAPENRGADGVVEEADPAKSEALEEKFEERKRRREIEEARQEIQTRINAMEKNIKSIDSQIAGAREEIQEQKNYRVRAERQRWKLRHNKRIRELEDIIDQLQQQKKTLQSDIKDLRDAMPPLP